MLRASTSTSASVRGSVARRPLPAARAVRTERDGSGAGSAPNVAAVAAAAKDAPAAATSASATSTSAQAPARPGAAAFAASFTAALLLSTAAPAGAVLNEREAELGGEFGIGSAQQWGEATIDGKDFSGEDLRRANFTSASIRNAIFKNCKLQGSYMIKSVAAGANFENADLSDALFDRSVIVDANLRNAILRRVVFSRSDLSRSDITGADFTNALVDKSQQIALCRVASGTNPVTGADTRKSLGCGSKRRYAASVPSNPDGPQVAEDEKEAFRATLPVYRHDLKDAIIEGADFTNSLVDKTQQITLCRYASGTNPVTGVDTRKSLGCGSKRRYAASVPSNPEGPQVAEDEEEAFRATMPVFYRL